MLFDLPLDAACWQQAVQRIGDELAARQVHAANAVVLVPYLQVMADARQAWARYAPAVPERAVFTPHIETTQTWATALSRAHGPFVQSGHEWRGDAAIDRLTADTLLQHAGLGSRDQLGALARRLVETAAPLARVAVAVPPAERAAWGQRLSLQLQGDFESAALAFDGALARIALAWVATSGYATDCLFDAKPDLLIVLQGFMSDPLGQALCARLGDRAITLPLCAPTGDSPVIGAPTLHAAADVEDEAGRAAACVLQHLAAGRAPVALIAQDRLLTRRVGAMLQAQHVSMRDETGWRLSTTRAAAGVMGLLRAAAFDASADTVLDWLKNAPTFRLDAVNAAEAEWRRAGVRAWRDLPDFSYRSDSVLKAFGATNQIISAVQAIRAALGKSRPLPAWLSALRGGLRASGQWDALAQDDAGQTVLGALRLHDGLDGDLAAAPSMTLATFTRWADDVLEAATFSPPQVGAASLAQVVILPLANLLGRHMPAVVLPGCDERRLAVSPEPVGPWTPSQRAMLGLPTREELADTARQAWAYALRLPHVDVLWRTSEAGEPLAASGFVQALRLDYPLQLAPDTRGLREVPALPTQRPQAIGSALPVTRLSATAYEDLRRCPYRFFALRQLGLQPSDELESEIGKRDFGNWLHATLRIFHEALQQEQATPSTSNLKQKVPDAQSKRALVAMINVASEQATRELALSDYEFLPFAASWPRVRDGYLDWLAKHEADGAQFMQGEVAREVQYGALTLVGKLDRVDVAAGGATLVIDYKTEPRSVTAERIKLRAEDTQLAFYAALVEADTLQAAYVNLGEKEPTKTYVQADVSELRDELVEGLMGDMAAIAAGAELPALGEGKACDYCNARGLCRKDFWS